MHDSSDTEKSAASDAFKVAAVRFGVGRYLYGDGIARFDEPSEPSDRPVEPSERPKTRFRQWLEDVVEHAGGGGGGGGGHGQSFMAKTKCLIVEGIHGQLSKANAIESMPRDTYEDRFIAVAAKFNDATEPRFLAYAQKLMNRPREPGCDDDVEASGRRGGR